MPFVRLFLTASVAAVLAAGCEAPTPAAVAAPGDETLVQSAPADRRGSVRLVGRAFADDGGAWNALGASLFWALWGEAHDPERLDANLAHLAEHHVDYVRVLAMVGAPSWADRVIDPRASDYWAVVDRLFDRLGRHRLRAQVVLLADAQVMMPDPEARQRFARDWISFVNRRRDEVQFVEIANEYFQNGVSAPEVRRLGEQVSQQTTVPVALSAPPLDTVREFYDNWPSVATLHYDRDQSGRAGVWAPVLQPWLWADVLWREDGPGRRHPLAIVNNEPIGPGSSLVADDDPLRLAAAFVTTFLSGNAAYTYHSGAGIRGGGEADRARGRMANFDEQSEATLDALSAWRTRLPSGLANWTRGNAADDNFPFDGLQAAVDRGILRAAPIASFGRHVIVTLIDQGQPIDIVARGPMRVQVIDLSTASDRAGVTLVDQARWTIPRVAPASVVFITRE